MQLAKHTVLPVGVPSQKTSSVDCQIAYASNIKAMYQIGNDQQWEGCGRKGNEMREKVHSYCNYYQKLKGINNIEKCLGKLLKL